MARKSIPLTEEISATADEVEVIWSEEARKALDAWAATYLRDSPLSRDTSKHNEVHHALAAIRRVLEQL